MSRINIFQKALQSGGQLLKDGCVYTERYSRRSPETLIQRTIAPNGSYAVQILQNGIVRKTINKTYLNGSSSIVDTWDSLKNRGIFLSVVEPELNKTLLSRVFDKVSEHGIHPDGLMYLFRKTDGDILKTEISTLNGITSISKHFDNGSWLNDWFYKIFNK